MTEDRNFLDGYIEAYSDEFEFSFDNEIILNWYAKRVCGWYPAKSKVLEFGIGHGFTASTFSRFFPDYSVIEGSQAIIDTWLARTPAEKRPRVIHGFFEDFRTTEKFDIVVLGFVLEHVDNPSALLKLAHGLLSEEGRLVVAVPNGTSLHRRLGHFAGLLQNMLALGQADYELGHVRVYSTDSLERELEAGRFVVTKKEGIFLKPLTTAQMTSLDLPGSILDALCHAGVDYPELSAALLFEAKPLSSTG